MGRMSGGLEITTGLPKRRNYIDIAKTVGVVLVVICHTTWFPSYGRVVYSYYMPMFFILAGMTYSHKSSVLQEIRLRAKRLLWPTFYFSAFLFIWAVLFYDNFSIPKAIFGTLYSRFYMYPEGSAANTESLFTYNNSTTYFLTCMFCTMVAVRLFCRQVEKRQSRYIYMAVTLIGAMLVRFLPVLLPWSLDNVFITVFFVMLGIELRSRGFFDWMKQKKFVGLYVCWSF